MANTWKARPTFFMFAFRKWMFRGFGFPLMHVIQVHLKKHHSAMVRWNSEWPSQLAKMLQNEILLLKKYDLRATKLCWWHKVVGHSRSGNLFKNGLLCRFLNHESYFCPQMYVVEGQKKILHSVENMPIIDHAWTMAVATRQMSTVWISFVPASLRQWPRKPEKVKKLEEVLHVSRMILFWWQKSWGSYQIAYLDSMFPKQTSTSLWKYPPPSEIPPCLV